MSTSMAEHTAIVFPTSGSVTALSARGEGDTGLYVVGLDGKVWTNFFPAGDELRWSGWTALGDNVFPVGGSVTALSTVPGGTSLYVVGLDGKVWTNFFPAGDELRWSGWTALGDNVFRIIGGLPMRLQFRLRYAREHESTDSGLQGASDEVWVAGVGLDSAAVTVGADGHPVAQTINAPMVGDVTDDRIRDAWRANPHVLIDFDLRRAGGWPRSLSVIVLVVEEDNQSLSEAFARLEAKVGTEVRAAAVGVATGVGAAVGSAVLPGLGTAVGAAVGAIAGFTYDTVIAEIKDGLENEAFHPLTQTLVIDDPASIRQHPNIDKVQTISIREHGAYYEIDYDWHLVD
jgi:hypothetical protein